MSTDFETIYENLYNNLLRISEQIINPSIDFAEGWNIMSMDTLKEMQDNSIKEHEKQKPKLFRNDKKCFIFGETSAGKSSLISAILKQKHLPIGNGRTSNCFVVIKKSQNDETYFVVNGEKQDVTLLRSKINYLSDDHFPNGTRVELFYSRKDCPILEDDTVIIDTPGIDTDKEMDRYIGEYCKDADLIVLVVESKKAISNTMKTFIHNSSTTFSNLRFLLIYNSWDEIDENYADNVDETGHYQNDRNAIKKQLTNDANKLFKECLKYSSGFENERIFFISAKEQMKFNDNNQFLKDNERWEYRHNEFERFMETLQEEMNINVNERIIVRKRKYEYLEELCDVQMKVQDECKSVIGIIENQIPKISLNHFIKLKHFESKINEEIESISKQSYDKLIKGLLKDINKRGSHFIKESVETISKQSLDKLVGKLIKEINDKSDIIIKESIKNIGIISGSKFIADLERGIHKRKDVTVKESIDSISKKYFDEIEQALFRKIDKKNIESTKGLNESISKQCYDNLIRDSVREINKRFDESIKNDIRSLLEKSYEKLKEDLRRHIFEKGKELLKYTIRSLSEQSDDEVIKDLYDKMNRGVDNIFESLTESYDGINERIFEEVKKENNKVLKNLFESNINRSYEKLQKYLLKEFNPKYNANLEELSKESRDNLIKEVLKAVEKSDGKGLMETSSHRSYDDLIKHLYTSINNKYDFIKKDFIRSILNESFKKFSTELLELNNNEVIKESIESILKHFFDKVIQELLKNIIPDEIDRIKGSNQSTSDHFYTNLTKDLLTKMNKKVNEVFQIQIESNFDRSFDCLLRDLFVVSNKNAQKTTEINELIKEKLSKKLFADLSNKIFMSESKVIKKWKESTLTQFFESLMEDLFKEIDSNEYSLIKGSIKSVTHSFYSNLYQDLLQHISERSNKIVEESTPLLSRQSFNLIINSSFEGIDMKYSDMDKNLVRLITKSYDNLKMDLQKGINKNNSAKIKNLIESISQQSRDNFIKDLIRVFKDKCKERIIDPLESVSKSFWDQLITDLLKEINQICNNIIIDSMVLILTQSHEKLRQNMLKEFVNKRHVTINLSIESVLKDSQNNLIKDLFDEINIKVEYLMQRHSIKELMTRIFTHYLTDVKEKVKYIIGVNESEDVTKIIEEIYFKEYLEPCFPNIDRSTVAKMNKSVKAAKIGSFFLSFAAPNVVSLFGGLFNPAILTQIYGSDEIHSESSLNKPAKYVIQGFGSNNEKIIKDKWQIVADLICRSHSKFLTEIKYKLFKLFKTDKKEKEIKEIMETLKCVDQEIKRRKAIP